MIPLSHQRIRVHDVASNNTVRPALYRCNPVCPTALYCTFICDVGIHKRIGRCVRMEANQYQLRYSYITDVKLR